MKPARKDRLPEQQWVRPPSRRARLGGNEAAGPQAPKPARPADVVSHPSLREKQIVHPAVPSRFAEIAGAVAAALQVDQQHAPSAAASARAATATGAATCSSPPRNAWTNKTAPREAAPTRS